MLKSEIFFSPNTPPIHREHVSQVLGAKIVTEPSKYLGLPAIIGRGKNAAFNPLKERIWKKIKGWKEKYLSFDGREVLLKAVAQAFPTYSMGLFKLPKTLCAAINGLMARFWWRHKDDKKHIHWIAWRSLCKSKTEGGLGFRYLEAFNMALLAKQLWRLLIHPNSLAARLMKARYYPSNNPLDDVLGHHPSFIWRSLVEAQWVLKERCRWLVRNGQSTRFWKDRWTRSAPSFRIWSPCRGNPDCLVNEFLLAHGWNEDKLRQSLMAFEVEEILKIPIHDNDGDDELVWHFAKNGEYSVKTGYSFVRWKMEDGTASSSSSATDGFWSNIWKIDTPPKVKSLLWRVCKRLIPSGVNLNKRVQEVDPTCCRCKTDVETDLHALVLCPAVKPIWECFGVEVDEEWARGVHNMEEWTRHVLMRNDRTEASKIFILLWTIWNERNHVLHGGDPSCPRFIVDKEIKYLESFMALMIGNERGQGSCVPAADKWSLPPEGCWKVSVDAAIFNEKGCGMGLVIRDHEGSVTRDGVKQVRAQWDVDITEAKATLLGLQMTRQMGIAAVILESDSQILITLLKDRKVEKSYLGNVVSDILKLSEEFEVCSFAFVKRTGNKAAHSMAHCSPLDYSTRVWIDSCPDLIVDIVSSDLVSAYLN